MASYPATISSESGHASEYVAATGNAATAATATAASAHGTDTKWRVHWWPYHWSDAHATVTFNWRCSWPTGSGVGSSPWRPESDTAKPGDVATTFTAGSTATTAAATTTTTATATTAA